MMRPLVSLSALVAALAAGCATEPPRDLSSAALHTTSAEVPNDRVGNAHVITEVDPSARALAILSAPDRLPQDRALDTEKQAADLLTFLDVAPGMKVAEIGCGGGYTTELFARAVGPTGTVYGANVPSMLFGETRIESAWNARLARPVNARVVRVDRELRAPLPTEAHGLDLVYLAIDYDRAAKSDDASAMNGAVHDALRTGGHYVVLVRTPTEGERLADLRALHTYESRRVRHDIEAAGFAFLREGRFFREGRDPRDWDALPSSSTKTGEKLDRFVLVFVRI